MYIEIKMFLCFVNNTLLPNDLMTMFFFQTIKVFSFKFSLLSQITISSFKRIITLKHHFHFHSFFAYSNFTI